MINLKRRQFLMAGLGVIAASIGLAAIGKAATKKSGKKLTLAAKPRLGINLAGLADWNSELPFTDLMRMSRDWVSLNMAGDWEKGPPLALDENGWVTALQKGCRATKVITSMPAGEYPSGIYTVLYDGEGELFCANGKVVMQSKGKLQLQIDAKKDGLLLELVKTNPQNYLRNIRFMLPDAALDSVWSKQFLQRWQGIACLRYMDWMSTNGSNQISWQKRPTIADASFAGKGVALELMVDLANQLNTDAWFCMPHLATDDYVKQFASYVHAHLNPNLRAWVEYSNEVWNGGFAQAQYAAKQGLQLGFAKDETLAGWRYYAHRSVQIFNIWHTVFNGSDRLVRVLSAQAAYAESAKQILSFNNAAKKADVLAIAPYINFTISTDSNDFNASKVANWSLDKIFEYIKTVAAPEAAQWIVNNKKLADEHGLQLVAYESGQHLVGTGNAVNNDQLTALLLQANADARMGEVYADSLHTWQTTGGDLNCTFNSVGGWSKWGSWGLLQHYNDKPSYKFKAVIAWAKARGQAMVL